MSNRQFQLNYDELTAIAKHLHDESDEIAQLYATTRQRVRDLYKDWVGEGADKFFDEMETEVLPALERVSRALLFSHDTTHRIMRIIHDADEETTGFFKNDLNDDFGASGFGAALGGLQGGSGSPDDFGAKQFESAALGQQGGGDTPPGGATQPQGVAQQQQQQQQQQQPAQMPGGGAGGSGGSSGGSQGLQGDLKGLGSNFDGGPQQNMTVGGSSSTTGSQSIPDHIYNDSSGSSSSGDLSQGQSSSGSSGGEQSSSGSGGVAAGVAGLAGAAGAANALKGKKKNN